MALIKENGSGLSDANSYADVADGDNYHNAHLHASVWLTASSDDKAKALMMATRVIDAECRFNGFRAHETQALQWPRERCPDPDTSVWSPGFRVGGPGFSRFPAWLPDNVVPRPIIDATCELARELLIADRTAAPAGEGIDIITSGAGATYSSTKYSKSDTPRIIPRLVQAMLAKYGGLFEARSATLKLVRT